MTQTNLWTVGIPFKQSVSCLSIKSGTVVAAVVEEQNDTVERRGRLAEGRARDSERKVRQLFRGRGDGVCVQRDKK